MNIHTKPDGSVVLRTTKTERNKINDAEALLRRIGNHCKCENVTAFIQCGDACVKAADAIVEAVAKLPKEQ